MPKKFPFVLVLSILFVLFAGIITGKVLSGGGASSDSVGKITPATKTVKEAGVSDTSQFKDTAQGTLEVGGIEGEGQFHLVRPGGNSQTVYLTSTIVDLASFTGKKVQVWGQTLSARKAGWLMDVGKVKVIE